MTTAIHVRARVDPWDDAAFVKAFEHALERAELTGVPDSEAGPYVQRRLRETGYPRTRVIVGRTADEALHGEAGRWNVRRDG
jgi:hypothetical protein